MKATAPARIVLPQVAAQVSSKRSRQAAFSSGSRGHARADAGADAMGPGGTQVAVEVAEFDGMGTVVFAVLRKTRLALSKDAKKPPYVVASDRYKTHARWHWFSNPARGLA